MTNKEAMEIVLEAARLYGQRSWEDCDKIFEATYQMEDYYNDVMEDDLIITQGDKKLKEMLED